MPKPAQHTMGGRRAGVSRWALRVLAGLQIAAAGLCMAKDNTVSTQWFKGNLHTHTLWSDGGDYPEMVTDWYKSRGYHFLSISDHNVMLEGERWIPATENGAGTVGLERYRAKFGATIDERTSGAQRQVRLKTFAELKTQFEDPGKFLLIAGEEISDHHGDKPVHLGATNLQELIPPQGGNSVVEVMQNNIDAVLAQRKRTGVAMVPHINHPNFVWGVSAEELAQVDGEQFFEVYNGHPGVWNRGDEQHPSTDRIWDLVLTRRLRELNKPLMYGTATDDAHEYLKIQPGMANPGQGWVMVRAAELSAEALIHAMEHGDFYATTGVVLSDVRWDGKTLAVDVQAEPGVEYTTQFIGTRGEEIGAVLSETNATQASYTVTGDELYVRAKVVSTKHKPQPTVELEPFETAWVQPVQPGQVMTHGH